MGSQRLRGLRLAFQVKGTVIVTIYHRVIFFGLFGGFVSLLYYLDFPVSQPILGSVIPSIVLGLLLVFRTNTAYDRFWEGRKAWGDIINNVRNLARLMIVSVDEKSLEDRKEKVAALRLLVAFAVATKLHLRSLPVNSELEELMLESRYITLLTMNHPPLEIAFWIGDYLQQQCNSHRLNNYQLITMQELINSMVDNLGVCERILKTPIPLAYTIHLKQLLILYCLLLPFQLVENLGWATGVITGVISFTLFGIEAIGLEIENPFGFDDNDLPLNAICDTMKRNIEDLISLRPTFESNKI
jgi:putative membrane protein